VIKVGAPEPAGGGPTPSLDNHVPSSLQTTPTPNPFFSVPIPHSRLAGVCPSRHGTMRGATRRRLSGDTDQAILPASTPTRGRRSSRLLAAVSLFGGHVLGYLRFFSATTPHSSLARCFSHSRGRARSSRRRTKRHVPFASRNRVFRVAPDAFSTQIIRPRGALSSS
jgi:hypothetical protein